MQHIELFIYIEIKGDLVLAGTIAGQDYKDSCFKYDKSYILNYPDSPISLSLPIRENKFSPDKTKNYFDGLLPEGFQRQSICQMAHLDPDNYLDLLLYLGKECLGAILVSDSKNCVGNDFDYIPVKHKEIMELAQEGVSKTSQIVSQSHLSLAGASGKVGLYYDIENRGWYKPIGTAPSTHIIKTEHVRLDDIVTNEYLCTNLADMMGIQVPETFIIDGEYKLFATKRYDRLLNSSKFLNNNQQIPFRLHQEDFAQAMGVASSNKYEDQNRGYLTKCFETIRHYSANPVLDQKKLAQIVIFNILIGNTDSHIKNIGLLRSKDIKKISLAPAYDLVSTVVYNNLSSDLAFYVGDTKNIYKVNRNSLKIAAREASCPESLFLDVLDEYLLKFIPVLEKTLHNNPSLKNSNKIKEQIIRHFINVSKNLSKD